MSRDILLKRLQYRSGHRGCKETDFVLGQFAEKALATLNGPSLASYERLLNEDDAHIWDWLTGKEAPAEYAELLGMMKKMVARC